MRLRFAYSSTLSFGRRCRAWPQPNTKWYNHYFKSNRVPHSTLHDNNKYTKTKADILVFAAIDSSRRLLVLGSLFPRFDIWCSLNSQWLWLWLCISVCSLLFHCCWLHSSHCYVTVRGNAHFMHTKYFFFYVSHEFLKRICSFLCCYLLLLFACRCRSLLFFRKYLFSCVTLSISVYFFVFLLLFGWFVCCSSTNCTVFFIAIGNNIALYVEMDTKILLWSEIASIACNGNAL